MIWRHSRFVLCGSVFGLLLLLAPVAETPAATEDYGEFGAPEVTRPQLDRFLPPPRPHPFHNREHDVLRLNGEAEPVSLSAELLWVSQPWNGENAQMPYLVYMPEKDRLLLLASCRKPCVAGLTTSDDHGKTWSPRRWMSVDEGGEPNANTLGLTYLGGGRLAALTEDMEVYWLSQNYGQTWEKKKPTKPSGALYAWNPALVVPGPNGQVERLAHVCYKLTGVPWGSDAGHYSQAYFCSDTNLDQTWSNPIKVPQWIGVNEVTMIVANNGDWVAACRTDLPKRFARNAFDHYGGLGVSISKDEGKTWSNLNMLYEWGRHQASMVLLPDGKILMTYVVRLGYPNNAEGFPQFGVEAVVSGNNGQTWDLAHRYVLAAWVGTIKGGNFWYCGVQSTSTVLLPDGAILTAFGTGFENGPETGPCLMDVAVLRWRAELPVARNRSGTN